MFKSKEVHRIIEDQVSCWVELGKHCILKIGDTHNIKILKQIQLMFQISTKMFLKLKIINKTTMYK